jgi:hypothetical protein
MKVFIWRREDEDTRRQKNDQTWFFFQNCPFWGVYIYILNQHIHFLVHGHSSWSTFDLHLVKVLKTLYIDLLRNQTMKVGPWNWIMKVGPWNQTTKVGPWNRTMESDHGKGPSSVVRRHGAWCKGALGYMRWYWRSAGGDYEGMEKGGATLNVIWRAWQTQDAPCNCPQGPSVAEIFQARLPSTSLTFQRSPHLTYFIKLLTLRPCWLRWIFISGFQERSIGYNHWGGKAMYGWLYKFSFKFIHSHLTCWWSHVVLLRLLGILLPISFTITIDWFLLHWKIPQRRLNWTSHTATMLVMVIFISSFQLKSIGSNH